MTTISFRATSEDEKRLARMMKYLQERLPDSMTANQTDALREALRIATDTQLLCPHCEQPLVESKSDDGGTLGRWTCPECSDGA